MNKTDKTSKNMAGVITFFIVIIASFLRVFMLDRIPAAFFRDEAALGYNSYSLLRTGADEYGMPLPLVFRSFEVFFLPLYEYLTAVFMAILGINELSTRIVSALAGTASVYLAYKIANIMWGKKAAIISSLIMALSPWSIYFSRGAFEGNLGLTLFSAGFYFWLVFREKHAIKNLYVSSFFFAMSMYSYQAERLVVFLFAILAVFLERKWIFGNLKQSLKVFLFSIVLLLPLISITFNAGGYHRAMEVSLFSKARAPHGLINGQPPSYYNDKNWLRLKEIASLYISYFSPRNIFIEGDFDKQRSVENFSVLYPYLMPFLIIGMLKLKKQKFAVDFTIFMLIAPVPASFTADPFHTYRSLLLYFPLTLLSGLGIFEASKYFRSGRYYYLSLLVIQVFYFAYFSFNYVFLTQSTRARYWDWGYKDVIEKINDFGPETKVVVDDLYTEPYILYLFFNRIEPATYHHEVRKLGNVWDYYYTSAERIRPSQVGNVEFRRTDWAKERGDSGTVFVFYAPQLPDSEFVSDPGVETISVIKYPDGSDAYKIVRIR